MRALRHVAFEGNFRELKKICKEEGVKVNEGGPETGMTALHRGAVGGHLNIVTYLLKAAHAEVDPVDNEGNTPLNAVIQAKLPTGIKLAIMDALLAHQADPHCPNKYGKSPLDNLRDLRDHIPVDHYYQRRELDSMIRKINGGHYNRAPGSAPSKPPLPEPRPFYHRSFGA